MAFRSLTKDNISLEKTRQKTLWIVLFVLFLIIMTILYFIYWRSSNPMIDISGFDISSLIVPTSDISIENILTEIEFDTSFVKNSQFQELKSYGEWPLKIEEKGRHNPFQ